MPIKKKWTNYTPENASKSPDSIGYYEIGNRLGNVIYIGEGNIKGRLQDHLNPNSGDDYFPNALYYRYEITNNKVRAVQRQNVLLAEFEKTKGRLPEHNTYARG